ncbi:hypothetical protein ABT279_50855, partial [Amycolatopsis sp. NPDC000673]
ALAELAGEFVAARGSAAGALPTLRVRGYFGPREMNSGAGAYEASVVAALTRGVKDRLAAAGMDTDALSAAVADVLAGLDMEPVAVSAGDARAGTFVAWAGGEEPPVTMPPDGAPVVVSLDDLVRERVNPAEINVVALHSGEGQYAVGFPAPGPVDERSVLEEAFERRAERGQAAGLWVVQHHGADGLRGWSKDGSREFRLTPAAAKHLALSAVPAGVLAQGWPVCWLMCRPEGGDARVQALHNLFAAEGFELNVPSSRGVQVSRTGVFTGLAPGAEPAPGTFALGDDAQSGQRPRNLMPARTSEPAASGSASGTGQAADPGEGRAGSGTAEEIPALEVPPDGFGPVQQLAWALLVSGAGSVAGLHAGIHTTRDPNRRIIPISQFLCMNTPHTSER